MRYAVGMGISRTNLKAGVISEKGEIVEELEKPTETKNKDTLIEQITRIVKKI